MFLMHIEKFFNLVISQKSYCQYFFCNKNDKGKSCLCSHHQQKIAFVSFVYMPCDNLWKCHTECHSFLLYYFYSQNMFFRRGVILWLRLIFSSIFLSRIQFFLSLPFSFFFLLFSNVSWYCIDVIANGIFVYLYLWLFLTFRGGQVSSIIQTRIRTLLIPLIVCYRTCDQWFGTTLQ